MPSKKKVKTLNWKETIKVKNLDKLFDVSKLLPMNYKVFKTIVLCMLFFPLMGNVEVFAQANRTNSGDITCPASGSSVQVLPQRTSRYSMLFNNINGIAVRLGYLDSGTATLDATNSWVLQPGQATGDSVPGVLNKRVVCMSTTATPNVITFNETYR